MAGLVLRAARVVLPGGVVPAAVVVRDGRIVDILTGPDPVLPADLPLLDLPPQLVLGPGLVDSHVHINEPGRTNWEGFATATRAAAAGGVTTVVDMPLNSIPPVDTLAALETKRAAAQGQCEIDVAFWGGITSADTSQVQRMVDAGVCGFKAFLVDPGVPEFGHLDAEGLTAALTATAAGDVPLVVHAEWPAELATAPEPSGRSYLSWTRSRPPEAEIAAIARVIETSARTGGRAHILHLSTAHALPMLEKAAAEGIRVSAETCPHYLSLAAEELPDGATPAKCAPPVREGRNRDALWDGLKAGLLAAVVSDHSPASPDVKQVETGDLATAWGGVSGLQTQLPVVWTAARSRGVDLATLAHLQSEAPARLANLAGKGGIVVGNDADLVAWDPDLDFVVDPARLYHRHPLSPWAGATLFGVVAATWLRGQCVYSADAIPGVEPVGAPAGRLLERSAG